MKILVCYEVNHAHYTTTRHIVGDAVFAVPELTEAVLGELRDHVARLAANKDGNWPGAYSDVVFRSVTRLDG